MRHHNGTDCTVVHSYSGYRTTMQGFTLIELMISLVLGLLISAAVLQVYIISTRTITVQQSASEVQDSAIFSLQTLEDHIRIANLGNPITNINNITNHGGVVLSTTNLGASNNTTAPYFTNSEGSTGWTGLSNMASTQSDQLTIQYRNITPNDLYDCQGNKILKGSSDWVIERYFVRLATGASSGSGVQDLALACAAGRVSDDGTVTTPFYGNGEVIVPAVDQFQVLLGTSTNATSLTYLPAKTYLEVTDKPDIITVKLGLVIRSTTPLALDADKSQLTVLGKTQDLKADAARQNFYRRSYESTVLLRNARVMTLNSVNQPAPVVPTPPSTP